MEERGLIIHQAAALLEGTGGGSQGMVVCDWHWLTVAAMMDRGLLVIVPHLLEHMGLHLWHTAREGQLDQAVNTLAKTVRQKQLHNHKFFHSNPVWIVIESVLGVFVQSGAGYACSGPGQPVVASCAEREQPSRPSYTAEGSGLEAPWLKLHIKKMAA